MAGVARISAHSSAAGFEPTTTSMMTSWWSATLLKASFASAVRVTV